MKDRVAACIYPDSTSCRAVAIALTRHYLTGAVCSNMERRGIANLYSLDKRTTAGERHEENSEIKRGIYPREDSRT